MGVLMRPCPIDWESEKAQPDKMICDIRDRLAKSQKCLLMISMGRNKFQ